MKETRKQLTNSADERRRYLNMIFAMLRKREQIAFSTEETYFSGTEMRLIGEVLSAEYEGKRLISTRIADLLGITRSAVSQLVNKLEKEGVVKRVPDAIDRKIAYIEVTDEILEKYGEDLQLCLQFVGDTVEKFGKTKFEQMYELFVEFSDLVEKEKANYKKA